MKASAILSSFLTISAAVVSALPTIKTNNVVKIGKRSLILPDSCVAPDNTGADHDFMDELKRGLAEVNELVGGALDLDPGEFSWFTKFLKIGDYSFWSQLTTAADRFNLPEDQFSPIVFDCNTFPKDLCGPDHLELDGGPRLAFTDWENDIIYACPALWNAPVSPRKLIFQTADPSGGSSNLLCPPDDADKDLNERQGLRDYQVFTTTLLREIAHTGSAIRNTGHEFRFNDLTLHAKVERFGWMATMAYFERKCGFEIPIDPDNTFSDAIAASPFYAAVDFSTTGIGK